ncbi:MAG: hypothetical protein ACO1PI_10510 [Bacteroidota bacterium]
MKPNAQEAVDYFTQHKGFFWHWADNGQVIEWDNGETLCYKAEIVDLLRQLKGQDIVPFSSIILFIAACSDNYKTSRGKEVLETFLNTTIRNGKREVEILLQQSLTFMDALSGLPKDVKNSVVKKAHILSEVFQLQQNLSNITWLFLADELDSGRIDLSKEITRPMLLSDYFKEALGALNAAGLMYPTTEKLVMKVLTGLPEIPESIEVIVPETESKELLIQLTNEPTTAGIANLTTHLIAALNIPMHSQGSGEQPLGGISDITNKGSYDRLLLSELAQDEELLTARLVNNEALYFRREEPPEDVNRKRVILLDTTIKMWGKPRFFGISAALACTLNTKHGETIEAYVLGGDYHQRVDLFSKNGVVESLKELNPALHCGKALNTFVSEQSKTNNDEFILITGDWQHQSYDFQALFAVAKTSLNFIISVSRDGELRLFECINGNAKLINTTKFDLEMLVQDSEHNKVKITKVEKTTDKRILNRLDIIRPPNGGLYLPTTSGKNIKDNAIFFSDWGFVSQSANNRVLFWQSPDLGLIELLNFEEGQCCLGKQGNDILYILIYNTHKTTLHKIFLKSFEENKSIDFEAIVGIFVHSMYKDGKFYVQNGHQEFIVDCERFKISPPQQRGSFIQLKSEFFGVDKSIKKIINPGYSVITSFQTIQIFKYKDIWKLHFDNRVLELRKTGKNHGTDELFISDIDYSVKNTYRGIIEATRDASIFNYKFTDGSRIRIDPKGLAHLISSNSDIPSVSIVLIIGKPTACIVNGGWVCGWEYFTGDNDKKIGEYLFYNKYIQPFIDHIVACS